MRSLRRQRGDVSQGDSSISRPLNRRIVSLGNPNLLGRCLAGRDELRVVVRLGTRKIGVPTTLVQTISKALHTICISPITKHLGAPHQRLRASAVLGKWLDRYLAAGKLYA